MAQEQAKRDPAVPILIPASPAELWPTTIEEVASQADVVLQARLSRIHSYLDAKGISVYTDYRILDPKVIAGRLPSLTTPVPGPGVPLILTVWGGEVIVEGVTIRGVETNGETIEDGGSYLLFLKPTRARQQGLYEVHYGAIFDIADGTVTPLLKQASDVFKSTIDGSLKDFVSRIQAAAKVR